ncbi:MAG: mechanosensitive ion channel domain-containing protein [Paracoccaceae bacterium]
MIRLAALLVLLALPAWAQEEGAAAPADEIPIAAANLRDGQIAGRLREILGELGHDEIAVAVSEGVVTLTGTVTEAPDVAAVGDIAARIEGVVAVRNDAQATADLGRRLTPVRDRFVERIERVLTALPLLLVALIVGAAIVWFGLWLARREAPFARLAPNAFIAEIMRQVVRLAFGVLALVAVLDILGATALLGTILGAAGIVGLALGFAVKDTVENFIASIMLSVRQPFAPDDMVEIEGDVGRVIRLTSRATILMNLDGHQVRIPNATVFKARIVNFTRNPESRFEFEIGVAPDADLAAMRKLAEATIASLPFTIQAPPPQAWVDRIGDGAIFLKVAGWIDQRGKSVLVARGEAIRAVKVAVETAGVEVPDTTYRVDVAGLDGGRLSALLSEVEGDEGDPAPSPAPPPSAEEAASQAAASVDATDVRDRTEAALDRLVRVERDRAQPTDLLSADAPEE